MGSQWGKYLKVTVFGESHGKGVGCVVEGLPAGMVIDEAHLKMRMDQRRPGQGDLVTPRSESDDIQWLSGVLEGKLTGAPLTLWIENQNTRSKDYEEQKEIFRPSHADYTAFKKYHGHNDGRGGGHFSARLTAPLVALGALCEQLLNKSQIEIHSQMVSAGGVSLEVDAPRDLYVDPAIALEIKGAKEANDSIGGEVLTHVYGLPVGLGTPMFDSVEGQLSLAIFGIPGVKSVAFGAGTSFSKMRGSEANDAFCFEEGRVKTRSNHSGGINGGISNGMPIEFRCVFRPTSSIGMAQTSLNFSNHLEESFVITGRHDPCIALRGTAVVRAVTAMVMLDLLMAYKLENKALKSEDFGL